MTGVVSRMKRCPTTWLLAGVLLLAGPLLAWRSCPDCRPGRRNAEVDVPPAGPGRLSGQDVGDRLINRVPERHRMLLSERKGPAIDATDFVVEPNIALAENNDFWFAR